MKHLQFAKPLYALVEDVRVSNQYDNIEDDDESNKRLAEADGRKDQSLLSWYSVYRVRHAQA